MGECNFRFTTLAVAPSESSRETLDGWSDAEIRLRLLDMLQEVLDEPVAPENEVGAKAALAMIVGEAARRLDSRVVSSTTSRRGQEYSPERMA